VNEKPEAGGLAQTKHAPAVRRRVRSDSASDLKPLPAAAVHRRIVVIEDNADNRYMLRSLLELSGHQVAAAADGRTGLETISATRPEMALVDIDLPVMDGHEVARQVRALPECDDVYLIALTGHDRPDDRRRALEAGFDEHLIKPVDFDELNRFLASRTRHFRHADGARPVSSS
jgi:CheY-like chemotaxis protein